MDQMPQHLQELGEEDRRRLLNAMVAKVKAEGKSHFLGGREWEGEVQLQALERTFQCHGYLCPDEACFVYMVDGWGPMSALSGYAIATSGSSYDSPSYWPDWAQPQPRNLTDLLSRDSRKEIFQFLAARVVNACETSRTELPTRVSQEMELLDEFYEGNFGRVIGRLQVAAYGATLNEERQLLKLAKELRSVQKTSF